LEPVWKFCEQKYSLTTVSIQNPDCPACLVIMNTNNYLIYIPYMTHLVCIWEMHVWVWSWWYMYWNMLPS